MNEEEIFSLTPVPGHVVMYDAAGESWSVRMVGWAVVGLSTYEGARLNTRIEAVVLEGRNASATTLTEYLKTHPKVARHEVWAFPS
jgi:hypothetical protein